LTSWERIWLDDFEDADVSDWTISGGSWTASTEQKKNGLYSGKLIRTVNNSFNAYKTFTRQTTKAKFDLWVYIWDNGQFGTGEAFYCLGRDGATQIVYLAFHNDHNIYWYNGTSTIDTGLNWVDKTWHHVELEMDLIANTVVFKLDGVTAPSMGFQVADPTGVDRIMAAGYVYDTNSWMYWDDVEILKEALAPQVTTNAATSITAVSAILNANITFAGVNCDERGFDWGTVSGVYPYSWTETGQFGTGQYSHPIGDLPQGTIIYFRGKAHNDAGWGYGNELSFQTLVRLTISSTPPTSIAITVNGGTQTTPYQHDYDKNTEVTIVITESEPVTFGDFKYVFDKWENDSTSKTRVVIMSEAKTLVIYYVKVFLLQILSDATGTEFDLSVT